LITRKRSNLNQSSVQMEENLFMLHDNVYRILVGEVVASK
jgi:hypothetical protein